MSEMLAAKAPVKRRRYSSEFKAGLLQEWQVPDTSVANVALRFQHEPDSQVAAVLPDVMTH